MDVGHVMQVARVGRSPHRIGAGARRTVGRLEQARRTLPPTGPGPVVSEDAVDAVHNQKGGCVRMEIPPDSL